MDGVRIELEPIIGETRRRNDIRVIGSRQSGIGSHEYDVTVISLLNRPDRLSFLLPQKTCTLDRSTALINRHLQAVANDKRNHLPAPSDIPFTPLVFTLRRTDGQGHSKGCFFLEGFPFFWFLPASTNKALFGSAQDKGKKL